MTEQEQKILDLLILAHGEFIQLPIQHPHDQQEWTLSLHELQRIIMCRKTVREVSGFVNLTDYEKEKT